MLVDFMKRVRLLFVEMFIDCDSFVYFALQYFPVEWFPHKGTFKLYLTSTQIERIAN